MSTTTIETDIAVLSVSKAEIIFTDFIVWFLPGFSFRKIFKLVILIEW